MENREHFGTLTERMHSFREELLNTEASIDATRAVLATQAYQEHADKPLLVKRAFMLKNILENMPIFIEPQTLPGSTYLPGICDGLGYKRAG